VHIPAGDSIYRCVVKLLWAKWNNYGSGNE
jgi:hypothetical protein